LRLNIVLIDSENVQPDSIEKLAYEHFRAIIFLGANQKRIDVDIVKAVQALGSGGEYIQISGNGPNALDFHIAFYIGKYSKEYPEAYFHIISKDKGFDPLITHLKEKKIFCSRWTSISEIPLVKITGKQHPRERAKEFYEKRILEAKSRPASEKTLFTSINSHFLKLLSEDDVKKIIEALIKSGKVAIEGSKVTYVEHC